MNIISHNINIEKPQNISLKQQPSLTKPTVLNIDKVENFKTNPNKKAVNMIFELLKSSLTGKEINNDIFKGANNHDWEKFIEIANEASVTGMAYDSVHKLPKGTVPVPFIMEMADFAKETEEKHAHQEKILGELSRRFEKMGIETVQLKGIGLSMDYPVPQHRFGGDIDIFTRLKGTQTKERSNSSFIIDDMFHKEGFVIDDYNLPKIKHSEFMYDGVRIENHRFFVNKNLLNEADKVDEFLHKSLNPREKILPNGTKILVPSKEFNTVFLAQHAFQHFVFEGIDLHHITDWGMHIKENGLNFPKELKGTKLEEFTYAFTNLTNHYLGTNIKVPENKEYEEKIFNKILMAGQTEKMPEGLNTAEVLLYKANRFMKHSKEAQKYGGKNPIMLFLKTSLIKLQEPRTLLRRI